MTDEHLKAILQAGKASEDGDGWSVLPDASHVTLYAARNGTNLAVNRIQALRREGELVHARTSRGELYVVHMDDLFAGAVDGTSAQARKAGFV